jgi:hypothetical protein
MLKTLNPTPGHEQKLGRFIGSLWAINPGHSTTNEKFAGTQGGVEQMCGTNKTL